MTVFGIDPGARGVIAVLDEGGDLLEVHDMPSTPEANGRTATSAPLLAGVLARTHARVAFCELVGARPTDAKVTAFAFGRAHGLIEGYAGELGLRNMLKNGKENGKTGKETGKNSQEQAKLVAIKAACRSIGEKET
jgi:hypothetical protein